MKRTPFNEIHKKLGAKMVEFAGFEMPVQYSSIMAEHKCVRQSVGVFDVSHMGEFLVRGRDSEAFLQRNTLNDVTKLAPGQAQYTALVNENGFLLDDLIVYRFSGTSLPVAEASPAYMIVANAANIEKDYKTFSSRLFPQTGSSTGDVRLEDVSDRTALLSVQGPKSIATLQKLTGIELSSIQYYHFVEGKIDGTDAIISRTGYTGELGFEIFFTVNGTNHEELWNEIFESGREFNIMPIGLGARDTLRLEMGYCLYGNDIDETTNPIEAGLGWITKIDKGDFVGKQAIIKARQNIARKLVGFEMEESAIPRHGYEIHSESGKTQFAERVGCVTSGTFSPSLETGIGMGYVEASRAVENSDIFIDVRGKKARARVVKLPFVDNHSRAGIQLSQTKN
ncbi:MAG TPA: glycine cleavage system aminomethyltransferase GcvT [Candidatus Acidoferrales bacterium]|nr:glycine cleavage system aminomethyltransferase GcvT [Candidatus Acidoferrales bacterium]